MNRNLLFAVVLVTLLLISTDLNKDEKKQKMFDAILKKYGAVKASKLNQVYDALIKAGLPIQSIKLAISQVMHETGTFSGKQSASNYNNFSGIEFSGSKEQLATGAYKSPVYKAEKNGKYYAGYPSALNWAKDYIRIISRGTQKPIASTNPLEFATKLKANKYYEDTVANYYKNLTFYYNFLTKAGL